MADDPQTEPPTDESERPGQTAADEESYVNAYDLDGDGDVSPVEDGVPCSAWPTLASSRWPTRAV